MANSYDEAAKIASQIGYPILVRPSYVLGGRGMEIVYDEESEFAANIEVAKSRKDFLLPTALLPQNWFA